VDKGRYYSLDIILLEADKVYIRSMSNMDVMTVFKEAKDVFNIFFSNPMLWDKEVLAYEQGAWMWIYGIPLHA